MVLSDLLWGIRGVRVARSRSGGMVAVARRTGRSLSGGCAMGIFLDGVPYPTRNLDAIPVSWIAGMEVYRGATEMPPQFNLKGRGCGAIVLWTR